MPNCFTLTAKNAQIPEKLSIIDEKLCAYFQVIPDEDRYYKGWVDIEGLSLAMGKDWAWMRGHFPERAPIINWLEENYTPDSFYQHR